MKGHSLRNKMNSEAQKQPGAKKKSLKILAVLLTVSMLFSLASCGKKKDSDNALGASSESTANERTQGDVVQETDPYFSDTTIELDIPYDPDPSREVAATDVNGGCFSNGQVVLSYDINYAPTQEEQDFMDHLDYEDPAALSKYYDMTAAQRENGLLYLDMQGNKIAKVKVDDQDSIYALQAGKNGHIMVFLSTFLKEDMSYEHKIAVYNDKGERERVIDISDRENSRCYELSSGKILLIDPGMNDLTFVDGDGVKSAPSSFSDEFEDFFEIDGKGYILTRRDEYLDDDVIFHHFLSEVDLESGAVSSPKELAGEIPYTFYESNGKYYADGDEGSILCYDIVNNTSSALFHPEDMDTLIMSVADMNVSSDSDIDILQTRRTGFGELQETSVLLTRLHREAVNPHAGKRIVRVSSCNTSVTSVRRMIAAYNKRAESKARVFIYVQPQDLSEGFDKAEATAADTLLLSMKSGEGPDVIINCAEYGQFNSEDILVDLNTYMDGNNGIDRSLYYDNIFRAFEADGKLFQMPVTIGMVGFIGDKKVLGDMNSWDLTAFEQKIDSLGNDVYPVVGHFMDDKYAHESQGMLCALLYCDMAHYVNYSKREAYFDSDDFKKVLELSKKCGDRINAEQLQTLLFQYEEVSDRYPDALMMQDGVAALSTMYVGNLNSFAPYNEMCSGDPLFIGWPASKDKGMTAVADLSVGMSAFSECKDEAWDFIRFLISQDAQNVLVENQTQTIYVLKACEDADMKRQIEEYQKRKKDMEAYAGDQWTKKMLTVIDDNTAKSFDSVIERIHSSVNTNPKIMEIVMEEAEGFFKGQKSSEDVSKSLQNRITTLLAETK